MKPKRRDKWAIGGWAKTPKTRTCSGRPDTRLEADLVVSLAMSVGDLKRLKYSGPREKVGSVLTPEN
jgi:hypothetical protein